MLKSGFNETNSDSKVQFSPSPREISCWIPSIYDLGRRYPPSDAFPTLDNSEHSNGCKKYKCSGHLMIIFSVILHPIYKEADSKWQFAQELIRDQHQFEYSLDYSVVFTHLRFVLF